MQELSFLRCEMLRSSAHSLSRQSRRSWLYVHTVLCGVRTLSGRRYRWLSDATRTERAKKWSPRRSVEGTSVNPVARLTLNGPSSSTWWVNSAQLSHSVTLDKPPPQDRSHHPTGVDVRLTDSDICAYTIIVRSRTPSSSRPPFTCK